jgi:hypothetical protein
MRGHRASLYAEQSVFLPGRAKQKRKRKRKTFLAQFNSTIDKKLKNKHNERKKRKKDLNLVL